MLGINSSCDPRMDAALGVPLPRPACSLELGTRAPVPHFPPSHLGTAAGMLGWERCYIPTLLQVPQGTCPVTPSGDSPRVR